MKFNEAIKYSSVMSGASSSDPKTIRDPNKYPKKDFYAWDTGMSDRGTNGFTSDIHVLTQKELMGVPTYKKSKKKKK